MVFRRHADPWRRCALGAGAVIVPRPESRWQGPPTLARKPVAAAPAKSARLVRTSASESSTRPRPQGQPVWSAPLRPTRPRPQGQPVWSPSLLPKRPRDRVRKVRPSRRHLCFQIVPATASARSDRLVGISASKSSTRPRPQGQTVWSAPLLSNRPRATGSPPGPSWRGRTESQDLMDHRTAAR